MVIFKGKEISPEVRKKYPRPQSRLHKDPTHGFTTNVCFFFDQVKRQVFIQQAHEERERQRKTLVNVSNRYKKHNHLQNGFFVSNGFGKLITDKYVYQGSFKKKMKHGIGRMTALSNQKYCFVGFFKNDKIYVGLLKKNNRIFACKKMPNSDTIERYRVPSNLFKEVFNIKKRVNKFIKKKKRVSKVLLNKLSTFFGNMSTC